MYTTLLAFHSWLRWAVLIAALIAAVRGVSGVVGKRRWTRSDDRAGFWFVNLIDLQMLLGLVMYFFLSPITKEALRNFGAAMDNAGLRFWAVEHVFGMVVAIALAHAGRARTKKLRDDAARHKVAAICFVLALVAILISIPVARDAEWTAALERVLGFGSQYDGSCAARYFLVMRTPPLDVRTRIGAPPPPSVASMSRFSRPLTVIGKSLFMPPFVVPTCSCAE